MSTELAHKKADAHFCVALHRKVRIRLHPSTESISGLCRHVNKLMAYPNEKDRPSIVDFEQIFISQRLSS